MNHSEASFLGADWTPTDEDTVKWARKAIESLEKMLVPGWIEAQAKRNLEFERGVKNAVSKIRRGTEIVIRECRYPAVSQDQETVIRARASVRAARDLLAGDLLGRHT